MIAEISHLSEPSMMQVLNSAKAPVLVNYAMPAAPSSQNITNIIPDHVLRYKKYFKLFKLLKQKILKNQAFEKNQKISILRMRKFQIFFKIIFSSALSSNGGVITINIDKLSVKEAIQNINYVRALAGLNHVGILSTVSPRSYALLLAELARDRLWNNASLKKLVGENIVRILREVGFRGGSILYFVLKCQVFFLFWLIYDKKITEGPEIKILFYVLK